MITSDWNIEPARIDRNWRAITIELDAPRPGRIVRRKRSIRCVDQGPLRLIGSSLRCSLRAEPSTKVDGCPDFCRQK